jgi:CHASE1-domain containing sensor protein
MSNKLFLEKLKADIRQKAELEQEAVEQAQLFSTKINNMGAILKSKQDTWKNREKEIE